MYHLSTVIKTFNGRIMEILLNFVNLKVIILNYIIYFCYKITILDLQPGNLYFFESSHLHKVLNKIKIR